MKNRKRKMASHPLMCWDIVLQQRAMHQVQNLYSGLFKFQRTHQWSLDLHKLLSLDVDAVVLTNVAQEIIWTSQGFKKMTGYEPDEVIGRKPSFLQGELTQTEVRQHIREHLIALQPVSGTLVNYKKNGAPYYCSIAITPLFNQQGILKNFIALEKEIENDHYERTNREINYTGI